MSIIYLKEPGLFLHTVKYFQVLGNKKRQWKNTKVTVSLEASRWKRNRHMPKKGTLLYWRETLLNKLLIISAEMATPFSLYYLVRNARDCWVRNLAVCCVSPTASSFLWTYSLDMDTLDGSSTNNLQKIIPLCSSNALFSGAWLFLLNSRKPLK